MIDQNGIEWLTVTDAAKRLNIRPSRIWNWTSRGKVRKHRIGRTAYIHMPDAQTAEHAWRTRMTSAPEH